MFLSVYFFCTSYGYAVVKWHPFKLIFKMFHCLQKWTLYADFISNKFAMLILKYLINVCFPLYYVYLMNCT